MPITAPRPKLLGAFTSALALLLGLPPTEAQALGLGRPQIHSALGKPLDVSIPLTLAESEQLSDSCLRAEVSAGEARVPAGLLQLRVEGEPGQQRIRLQSQARIEEPALRITLALGCPLRLTREFNAFIDPPASATATPAPPPPVPAPAPTPVYVAPPVAEAAPRPQAEAQVATAPAPAPRPRPRPKPRSAGPRLTLERPEVLVAEEPRPAKKPATAPDMELTPELEAQISQLEQTVAQLRAELQARQQAEAQALAQAQVQAASAAVLPPPPPAPASAVASAPEPQAIPAPEPAPAPVRSARASPYRDPMTWVLTLALSLLAGSAAFYVSRWRDERARRERAYWRALHAAEGAAPPAASPSPGMAPPVLGAAAALPNEGQHQATRPQPRPMPWPPAPVQSVPVPVPLPALEPAPEPAPTLARNSELDTSMQATQPLPMQSVAPSAPVAPAARAAPVAPALKLTVADQLLDLLQQFDFLHLLGQHDAAADLLATCLTRGSAGAMPYLLLMELCQQRGEPEVFAELVKQFEQRFGAVAPQWNQSLARGRSLDACPSVIAHLQVVWSEPETAMTMLQELLAQGGGPGVQHFDLPAYRDLLTLYSIARDLYEAGQRGEGVDLMLPMDSSFGPQS